MKKEPKAGRSVANDSMPHDVAVIVVAGAVTAVNEVVKVGVKSAIKGIKARRDADKPKIIRP
jgi:hypothetical protein